MKFCQSIQISVLLDKMEIRINNKLHIYPTMLLVMIELFIVNSDKSVRSDKRQVNLGQHGLSGIRDSLS